MCFWYIKVIKANLITFVSYSQKIKIGKAALIGTAHFFVKKLEVTFKSDCERLKRKCSNVIHILSMQAFKLVFQFLSLTLKTL